MFTTCNKLLHVATGCNSCVPKILDWPCLSSMKFAVIAAATSLGS